MDQSYLISLETKHAELDRRIDEERLRPHPDAFLLQDLKKQKLKIKEELVLH
jgi:hypothetical protein